MTPDGRNGQKRTECNFCFVQISCNLTSTFRGATSLCTHSHGSKAECTQVNRGLPEVLEAETVCILLPPCFPVFIAVLFLEVRRIGAFILLSETTHQTQNMHHVLVSGFYKHFGTNFYSCKNILLIIKKTRKETLTDSSAIGTLSLSVRQCSRPMILKVCSAVPRDPRLGPRRSVDTFL